MLNLETNWEFVSDGVMGGISRGQIEKQPVGGRIATRLTGTVSLENNGGFIQMAADLKSQGLDLEASNWAGIEIDICGNDEVYDLRIRTDDLDRPWQSFRAPFRASTQWTTIRMQFENFLAHRTDKVLEPKKMRRLGVVAVGRVFQVDVSVSAVRLF